EVVLENDHAAVGTDGGPTNVAGFERRNPIRLAAVVRDAPDVRESTAVAIADEINVAVVAPHGPRIETVEGGQLRELLGGHVHHHDVALVSTAVVLAPIDLRLLVVSEPVAVG